MKSAHFFTELEESCIVVRVLSNLDLSLAAETEVMFSSLISHVDRKVQLDLSLSHHLDASGIGAIAFLYKRLQCLDFDLELIGLNHQAYTLMQTLGINEVIAIRSESNETLIGKIK